MDDLSIAELWMAVYENPSLFLLLFYGGSETIYCFVLVIQAKLE